VRNHFLDRGLATAAGHRNHGYSKVIAPKGGKGKQCFFRIIDENLAKTKLFMGDDACRAFCKRVFGKLMTIMSYSF